MRVHLIAGILFLIGNEGVLTGSTDTKEKISMKPDHEITAERILHLGQGINRKVRQQDPLSSSNSDGDMQLATQFRTKRSAALTVDFQQSHSFPYGSYYGQGSTSTNLFYPSVSHGHNNQQLLQPIYYPQNQNGYVQQYPTQYSPRGNDYSSLPSSYDYYSNLQTHPHYYYANQPNEYFNPQNLNTYSHPQLNYRLPQQYYYYQPQYLQPQQNAVYEPQPTPYLHPSHHAAYYQPMQENAIWNGNSYFPAQSSHTELEKSISVPHSNGKAQAKLQTDTKIGTFGHWDNWGINALTSVGGDVHDHGQHIDVLGYHELIDALYDENNLTNELGASDEY